MGIGYRIIVVDNDKNGSAKPVIETLKEKSLIEIIYDIEPEQNIALVRNKAISLAEGDFIVFVDDDEITEPDWLQNLVSCAIKYESDVVFGPVLPIYPENTPKWILKGNFFDRNRAQSGSKKKHGATNNALVKAHLFKKYGFQFNPQYGLTGGEDTELFHKISKSKFKLIWCDEAVVSEVVIKKRMTVSWLIKRAFRGGQVYARIFFPDMNSIDVFIWLSRRIIFLSICIALLPFSFLTGRSLMVKCAQKIASNLGQLAGLCRWQYQEYKV